MGKKYTTNFLEDTNGSTGASNQVLISTPTGIDWVDGSGSSIIGGPYLPLSAGSSYPLTGALYVEDHLILQQDGNNDLIKSTGTVLYHKANEYSFQDNSNNSWITIKSGKVGIGTTSPARKLQVEGGDFYTNDRSDTAGASVGYGGNSFQIRNGSTSEDLNFDIFNRTTSAWGTPLIIKNTGNVGIGTISPDTIVEVVGNKPILTIRDSDTSTSTAESTIRFAESNANDTLGNYWDIGYSPVNLLNFDFNGDTKMTILSGGNVGIGTTSPFDSKLQVAGRIRAAGGTSGGYFFGSEEFDGGFYAPSDGNLAFSTNNTERIRIDGNGNVGIGLTNPSKKLSVVSNTTYDGIQISGSSIPTFGIIDTTNNAKFVAYVRDSDATIGMETNHPLTINTNNTERMRITSAGRVGIGTASPEELLHIKNGDVGVTPYDLGTGLNIEGTTSNVGVNIVSTNTGQGRIYFASPSSNTAGAIEYNHSASLSSGFMKFRTGNSERMRIDGSGRVGIGTTLPQEKLDVEGNIVMDASNARLKIKSGVGGTSGGVDWTFNTASTQYARIDLDYDTRNTVGLKIDSGYPITLDFSYSHFKIQNNGSEKMRVDSSGNVGIGTTSPGTKLVIEGTNDAAGTGVVEIKTTGTSLKIGGNTTYSWIQSHASKPLYINQLGNNVILNSGGGNVGIGTASPATKFVVSDAGGTGLEITPQDANTRISLVAYDRLDFAYRELNFDGYNYSFRTSGNVKAVMLNNGNVGIGLTPNVSYSKLQIKTPSSAYGLDLVGRDAGSNSESQITFWNSTQATVLASIYNIFKDLYFYTNGDNRMIITSDGKVGIGVTSPQSKLQVAYPGNVNGGSMLLGQGGSGTSKWSFLAGTHYNQASGSGNGAGSAGVALIGSFANSTTNVVYIGGGPYEINAATQIKFYTNSTNLSTQGGTHVMNIANNGSIRFNTYDGTNKTGTPTYLLGTDASGNVVKTLSTPGGDPGPYLPLAGGTMTGTNGVVFPDSFKLKLGTGNDAQIKHDGSHLFIDNSVGNSYLRNTSTGSILLRNSTGGDIQFDNEFAGNILFNTSNIERMRITSAGTLLLRSGAFPTNQDSPFLYRIGGGSLAIGSATETGSGAYVALYTNSSERMRIDSSGRVGIGTTSPASEANLSLGANSTSEGGHLVLFKGTSQTQATHLDNYSNTFRIMNGADASSGAVQFSLNHTTAAATFVGTVNVGTKIGLPDGGDLFWDGGYSVNKPVLAANGTTMKMYPSGASGGVQFSLTPTTATFAGSINTSGSINLTNGGLNTIAASNSSNGYLRFLVDQQGVALTLNADTTSTFGGIIYAVDGNKGAPGISFANDTDTGIFRDSSDKLAFATGANTRMIIESNGEVGINQPNPSATLHLRAIASNGVPFKLEAHPSTSVSQMLIYATKAYNSTDAWYNLVCEAGDGSGGQTNTLIIERDGDVRNKNNSYGQISDIRLKENITDATPKLEDIKKLKVKNFNLIGDDLKQIGLIAQEVEEVFPGLVKEDKQPDVNGEEGGVYKSVKYSVLVPMLIKAMQEQQEQIDELKKQINN